MLRNSIFWRINASFFAFTAALALGLGLFVYSTADNLGFFLIQQQVKPVMTALVAAERRWRDGPDREASDMDIMALAQAVGATFMVGKEVPVQWRQREDGLHILGNARFVYLVRGDGITYALYGTSRAMENFLMELAGNLVLGGLLGLLSAGIVAALLGRQLAAPLVRLARSIDAAPPGNMVIPPDLRSRRDEIGRVANAIAGHERLVRDYCRREAAFTGDVSHELRTPLAILTGTVEILSARANDPHTQKVVERLERTVNGMSATVQALLSLARKNSPEPQLLDISRLVREQLDLLRQAGLCRHEVQLDVENQAQCLGQPDLAATAIANVLNNACRHAAAGPIHVTLDNTAMHVVNKGELAERNDHPASCGLGLSITGRACEKMGWDFRIAQNDGEITATLRWAKQ